VRPRRYPNLLRLAVVRKERKAAARIRRNAGAMASEANREPAHARWPREKRLQITPQ